MAMPDLQRAWTRAEVLALPDDGMRHELFDGELVVTPAPRRTHEIVVLSLYQMLQPYVMAHALGWLSPLLADLPLRGGQVAQPDLFVLPHLQFDEDWGNAPVPLLVVEVLSPSTARHDRGLKRRSYQKAGVPEYWIVDAEARLIERWRPGDSRPEVALEHLTWQPRNDVPPLDVDVGRAFEIPSGP
jgi:Uma2 family endonuclease